MDIFLGKDICSLPIVDTTKIVHFSEKMFLGRSVILYLSTFHILINKILIKSTGVEELRLEFIREIVMT